MCNVTVVYLVFFTLVYAFNERSRRVELWDDLRSLRTQDPLVLCGDFYCIMNADERLGSSVRESEMINIRSCMMDCFVEDIKCTGNFFTWNNKQHGDARVLSKLDRVLANQALQDIYSLEKVCFQCKRDFDHSSALITVHPDVKGGEKKPFKYFHMWRNAPQFGDIIREAWNMEVQGTRMFNIMKKLKRVKVALKEVNKKGFQTCKLLRFSLQQVVIEKQQQLHQ